MSIHWPIIRRCLAGPGRTAIVDDRRATRRAELLVAALHTAAHLAPRCESSTVGVLLPTSAAFPVAALAGWMLGKTVVPLNYLLRPEELRFVIEDCGADTVVTAQAMLEFLGAPGQAVLDGLAGRVRHVVRLEEVGFTGAPELAWPARAEDEDLALLLYTSGTTGRPKGVMLTHGNISANIRQVMEWVHFTAEDSLLGVLPQFHSFGLTVLTLLPLTAGLRVVYTARFVPGRLVRLLREHRPTVFIAIPSMYNALLHAKDAAPEDFASLRYVVSGGEPLPASVADGFRERFGVTIAEGFGMTETGPVTNWCRPAEYRPRSVGRALPGVVERITDPASGRDLPPGQDGELRIAGPNVMRGYYNRPEETAAAFDERGFLRSGDIGRFDEDGFLYITGRLKEMLIVGGENVFPREIEEVLNQHPSVKESGVVGVTDPVRGELPLAFVEVREGHGFDERALLGWCRQRLAGYKVPREIRRVESLPRNATGKVSRRELKAMANAGGEVGVGPARQGGA
jgi:long-chain acyl-CoA synthetase